MELKLNAQKEAALKRVADAVLREVKPSAAEARELTVKINAVMGRLKKVVPKNVEIMVAGSAARGTNLKGNSDIDIFLLFSNPVPKSKMESVAIDVAKKMVKGKKNESYIVRYAEHPYARLFLDGVGLRVDLVPAYKIASVKDKITSVDRTQLHNEFVKSALSQRQQDDVRVLKALLKAHVIYGAEAKIEGFSGYLCELLTYSYGSFSKLLVGMANAKPPVVINLSDGQHDPAKLVKVFGKKLIVIDPTDEDRNVAANVSDESFARFALLCRVLLMWPTEKNFRGVGYSDVNSKAKLSAISKKLGVGLYAVSFQVDDISDEVIWQQLKKMMISASVALSKLGFAPLISLQEVDGTAAVMGFMINESRKSYKVVVGPSALMRDASEAFMLAHGKSVIFRSIESDRLYVVEEAECTTPEEALRYVLKEMAMPSHFKKSFKVYINNVPEAQAKLLYRAYFRKTNL
jgi:tRNA nucleotidyltransferase (CCA-adding enzyme)